jgi:hypothetical protein
MGHSHPNAVDALKLADMHNCCGATEARQRVQPSPQSAVMAFFASICSSAGSVGRTDEEHDVPSCCHRHCRSIYFKPWLQLWLKQ